LASSIDGNNKRPYGIIIGFIASFALFTMFSRNLVLWFGIDLNLIRAASFGLLLVFGAIMLSEYLSTKFGQLTQGFANLGSKLTDRNNDQGFISGILFGALVGLIWTPCAGPILAAVLVQSISQTTNFGSFLTILAFGIGAALPMLIIIIFGRKIMSSVNFFQNKAYLIRKMLGVIIITAVLSLMLGNNVPSVNIGSNNNLSLAGDKLIDGLAKHYTAPDFADISAWFNSDPLSINQLRGKVVLVDFWAYSCINCIRTLPYLKDWYDKYQDVGLVIVGVHAPEFDFERDANNVHKAIEKFEISYPVALDNKFATWQNYNNHFWPAHYLINKNGNIVYQHFGEGDYDITENNIRFLLGTKNRTPISRPHATASIKITPETYLGYARSDQFASPELIARGTMASYSYPKSLTENSWALSGDWIINAEKIVSQKAGASIKMQFYAKQVFSVMGAPKLIKVKILKSNEDLNLPLLEVKDHTLYEIANLANPENTSFELIATDAGLELYTFTFGG